MYQKDNYDLRQLSYEWLVTGEDKELFRPKKKKNVRGKGKSQSRFSRMNTSSCPMSLVLFV